MTLPLENVRVLDLTRFLTGPYCTMTLGDMGADVVKVERPGLGDDTRAISPKHNGESWCFAMVNRNKRSVVIDVTKPDGRDLLLRMAESVDVFVENFRPGVTERLGIDAPTLLARNPALVYCSITGFGQTGPYRERAGFDIIAQGVTGFLRMTGHPGDRPAKFGVAITDLVAGATAVQAILAAYVHRLRTGEGQHLDISLVDAGLALTPWEAAAYFGTGEVPAPTGSRHRRNAPYQAFRTQDGYVTIGANTDRMWQALCTSVLQRPELLTDPRYDTREGRVANVEDLEADIEAVTTTEPTAHWVRRLDEEGIAGGPVYTYDQALADEHVVSRGMVQEVEHPALGTIRQISPPARFSETPLSIRRPAPLLGEHTAEILAQFGVDDTDVERLRDAGVVDGPPPTADSPKDTP